MLPALTDRLKGLQSNKVDGREKMRQEKIIFGMWSTAFSADLLEAEERPRRLPPSKAGNRTPERKQCLEKCRGKLLPYHLIVAAFRREDGRRRIKD